MRVLLRMASHCEWKKKSTKNFTERGISLRKKIKLRKKGSSISSMCVALFYVLFKMHGISNPIFQRSLLVILCSQWNETCYITKKRILKNVSALAQIFDKTTCTRKCATTKVVYYGGTVTVTHMHMYACLREVLNILENISKHWICFYMNWVQALSESDGEKRLYFYYRPPNYCEYVYLLLFVHISIQSEKCKS